MANLLYYLVNSGSYSHLKLWIKMVYPCSLPCCAQKQEKIAGTARHGSLSPPPQTRGGEEYASSGCRERSRPAGKGHCEKEVVHMRSPKFHDPENPVSSLFVHEIVCYQVFLARVKQEVLGVIFNASPCF